MEVLVLGMPRTGTQSLADALVELGYGAIYHMREVGKNQHQKYWIAALEAKYEGKGKAFVRDQWDSFLSDYSGVSDIPAAIFAAELTTAYPNAKIILTVRDEDKWYDSMLATVWHAWSNTKNQIPSSPMRTLSDLYHKHLWNSDFPTYGRVAFREHNDLVRSIAPKHQFLEYDVKEGWEPLCEFLGKEVPEKSFPRADDWLAYKKANGTGTVNAESSSKD